MTGIAALVAGGAVAFASRRRRIAGEREVEDARMQADFADGNVRVVDGWMVSQYEVDALGLENDAPLLADAP